MLFTKPLGPSYCRLFSYIIDPTLFFEHKQHKSKINQLKQDLSIYRSGDNTVIFNENLDTDGGGITPEEVVFDLIIFYETLFQFKKSKQRYPYNIFPKHKASDEEIFDKFIYWEWKYSPLFKDRYDTDCLEAIVSETALPSALVKIIVSYLPGPGNCLEEAIKIETPIVYAIFSNTPINLNLSKMVYNCLDYSYVDYVHYKKYITTIHAYSRQQIGCS